MPNKYNRNRNTLFVPRDRCYQKQGSNRQFQTSTQSLKCFLNPEKTFISLKLLEKCSQKMFNVNEQFYDSLIEQRQDFNKILSLTTVDTRKDFTQKQNQDNYLSDFDEIKESHQNKVKNNKDQDQLISSWTAFENLDITYKIKQRELTNQNMQLRKNIQIIEKKLKSIYETPQNVSFSTENQQQIFTGMTSNLQQSNLSKIQSRIQQHKVLIDKMKCKIEKKKSQKEEYSSLFKNLLKICNQKYGQKSSQLIKKMFQKDSQ